ncbi:MAG TPA: DnaD domain protein [Dehalococcoidales bacterium]
MSQFAGFPARMQFTALPNLFFSHLLPQISDMAELKTTLYIFWVIYNKRGYPRFTTYRELAGNPGLMANLREVGRSTDEVLRRALDMVVKRGTILHVAIEKNGVREDAYFLSTRSDRQTIARIESGELTLPGFQVEARVPAEVETGDLPDIFKLYEENIGMLTPLIADELREAEKLYPEDWIRDAIKEAVNQNKRKWNYVSYLLERWAAEGKSDGTYRRDIKKTDPDKYIRGKYGHMVRR